MLGGGSAHRLLEGSEEPIVEHRQGRKIAPLHVDVVGGMDRRDVVDRLEREIGKIHIGVIDRVDLCEDQRRNGHREGIERTARQHRNQTCKPS